MDINEHALIESLARTGICIYDIFWAWYMQYPTLLGRALQAMETSYVFAFS